MKRVLIFLILLTGCAAPLELKKGNELFSEGNYIEALNNYEIALQKAQTDSQRSEISNAIDQAKTKVVDNILHEAFLAYSEFTPPSVLSIEKAISILDEGIRYDDKLQRLAGKIDEYTVEKKKISSEINRSIEDANNLISKGELLEALAVLRRAQTRDPSHEQLRDQVSNLTDFIEGQKQNYLDQINKLLANLEGEKAGIILKKLALIAPDYPRLQALQAEIASARTRQLLQKIPPLESQDKYYTAFRLLVDSGYEGLDDQIARISSLGSGYYYDKAKSYSSSGETYLAYVAAVKAKELAPNDIRIFQLLKKHEDIIGKEIQKYIAILTFGAPANDPDAGKLFSGALMSRLFKALPYGINIIEKENIDVLEKDKTLDLQNLGNRLGVDLIITGNVSLFKVDKNVFETMASQRIKIGEETKPNPEFSQMLETYGKDIEKWPHRPPMTYTEEKFEIIKHKKGRVDLKAFGNVSIRIFDAKKARIVFAKDLNETIEASDDFQEPVPGANIPEDILELPSETEIKGQLRDNMIQTTLDIILDIFKNREDRFLQWAMVHIKRKEYREALKFMAQGHLYCKNTQTKNRTANRIYHLMIDLTEEY